MEIRSSIGPTNGKTANPCDIKSGRFSFFKKSLLGGVFVLALFCSFSSALAQVSLLYQKDGSANSDRMGWSVAGAGDVNGDGRADFLVGAALADPGGISNAGSAYLYSGATGALLYQKNGSGTNGQLGWSVAGAGDVNGDGRGDFIVGSPNTAFVYSGVTGALLYQKSAGYSVGGAGDVDGDGRADFILGSLTADPGGLTDAGSAFVYSGATGALLYQKNGVVAYDNLGSSVAGAGDVDEDGRFDFIVGAYSADPGGIFNAGSAFVYSGATGALLYQKNGTANFDGLGGSVAGAGDVNGDGRADFIIGARGADGGGADAGAALVYSGATGALLYRKDGGYAQGLGRSVAGAGDVDGDGRADFLVGGSDADVGGLTDAGTALVYSGASGALLFQKNGSAAFDNVGYSVAVAGDLNGDDKADFLIGAPFASPGGLSGAGSAYGYSFTATDVPPEKKNRPVEFELSQNYPNPFNPATTIRYYLYKRGNVTLEIFNLTGQRVKILVSGEQSAGEHTLTWDAFDDKGRPLPSGAYFYRLRGKSHSEVRQMIYLK